MSHAADENHGEAVCAGDVGVPGAGEGAHPEGSVGDGRADGGGRGDLRPAGSRLRCL